jgi:hypothetical protein
MDRDDRIEPAHLRHLHIHQPAGFSPNQARRAADSA